MKPITRRSLLRHSAAGAVFAGMAGGVSASVLAADDPSAAMPALFVFDARFVRSAALADSRRSAGSALLDPRVADLGVAWRGRIPALLEQGLPIEGLTLWSDGMISEIFARDLGASFHAVELASGSGPAAQLYHWRVSA